MAVNKANIKELFRTMLKGMSISEESYSPTEDKYKIDLLDAMEKASNDKTIGLALYLMAKSNWNDMQTMANEFGVGWNKGGEVIDLPPRPTIFSFWDCKEERWKEYERSYGLVE